MWNSCNANICYIRYNLKLKSLLIIINRYTLSIFNSYIYPVITRYKIKIFKFYLISSVFINVKILYSVYSCISTIAPESIISEYTKSKYCISNFIINVITKIKYNFLSCLEYSALLASLILHMNICKSCVFTSVS